jgi:molybdopterin biosynthesis enzyme MoaB
MNRADKYGLEMKDVLQQHLSNTAETEIVEDDLVASIDRLY